MNNDEKILKALADLRADVSTVKDVQQQQGKHLEALQTDVKGLHGKVDGLEQKVDTVELKVETINAYQKQAHAEIMEHLIESNEVNGHVQQHLEKEIELIKKHVVLPPVK
jgi:hypothetical protein